MQQSINQHLSCYICTFRTADDRELQIHILGHTLDMDILKYIFDSKQVCKVETETGTINREIFTCPVCRKTFSQHGSLYDHLMGVHV